MRRQNLPSPYFPYCSSLPLSLTAIHLFSNPPSSTPYLTLHLFLCHFSFLSVDFTVRHILLLPPSFCSFFLPNGSHTFLHCFEKKNGEGKEVSWAGKFPHKQRKNVFLLFCTTNQYSLRSGLGPRSSLGMAWKVANNNSPSEKLGHSLEIVLHAGMPGRVSQNGNRGIESIPRLRSWQASNNGGIMTRPWLTSCAPEGLCLEIWESAGVLVSADGDVNVYVRRSVEGWVKDQESLYKNKLHGKSSAPLLRNMNVIIGEKNNTRRKY